MKLSQLLERMMDEKMLGRVKERAKSHAIAETEQQVNPQHRLMEYPISRISRQLMVHQTKIPVTTPYVERFSGTLRQTIRTSLMNTDVLYRAR